MTLVQRPSFSHPQGGSVTIEWDTARARRAGLDGKDMYKKFPRQMLRSRVVSEGVRTVFPAATSGMYVPEEVRDMAPEPAPTVTIDSTAEELDNFAADAGDEAMPRDLRAEGRGASLQGTEAFRAFWRSLSAGERAGLERDLPEFERAAKAADAPLVQEEPGAVEPNDDPQADADPALRDTAASVMTMASAHSRTSRCTGR